MQHVGIESVRCRQCERYSIAFAGPAPYSKSQWKFEVTVRIVAFQNSIPGKNLDHMGTDGA